MELPRTEVEKKETEALKTSLVEVKRKEDKVKDTQQTPRRRREKPKNPKRQKCEGRKGCFVIPLSSQRLA